MNIEDIVRATVTGVVEYGVFVKVGDVDGLIHISEISEKYVKDVSDFFRVGDMIDAKVIGIDADTKRLKLSYKQIKRKSINRFYSIGFTSLEEKLPEWIESKLKELKRRG